LWNTANDIRPFGITTIYFDSLSTFTSTQRAPDNMVR